MLTKPLAFLRNQAGTSAIELALVLPILILVMYATVELNRYLMFQRRGEMATMFAAEYLSRDGDNILTFRENVVWQDIWMIVNPTAFNGEKLRTGTRIRREAVGYSRWATSVDFERDPSCTDAVCDYLPDPLWSLGYQESGTGGFQRDCDLSVVSDTAPDAADTIRAGEVGRSPVVIVDMAFEYVPILSSPILPDGTMQFTAVRSTRSGLPLTMASNERAWDGARCPT